MNKKSSMCLQFDRKLSSKERVFWNNFFNNFPCDSNRYLQSWLSKYEDLNQLMQDYNNIKDNENYDCLKENINIDEFIKANKYYELLCPEAKKENHFLMCIFGLVCQDCPIKVSEDSIYIPNDSGFSDTDWQKSTIVISLAMCVDLMAGRINQIYPNLKDINPVKINGDIKLPQNYNKDIILNVDNLNVKRYLSNDKIYQLDFEYSFANNGDNKDFLSPFNSQQQNFLRIFHHQRLEENLEEKKLKPSNKLKI